jgi:protein O-GlcNAc transferase
VLPCWVEYRLALWLIRMAKTEQAIKRLERVIQQCPDHLHAHSHLAWCFLVTERYEEAIPHYRVLASRRPHWAQPWIWLGEVFQRSGRHDEAIAAYSSAIERDLKNVIAYYNLAESYVAKGDFQSALVAYRRVMNMEPVNGKAAGNLGATLGRLGHWRDAVEWHRKAMALLPNKIHAYNLGVALYELNELTEAESAFREALRLGDTSGELIFRLLRTLSDQGRSEEGLPIVEHVLANDPSHAWALIMKSETLVGLNCPHDALAVARLAVQAHPDMKEARGTLAWALMKTGQPAEALLTFESLKDSGDLQHVAGRGAALTDLGRHQEAMAIFDQIEGVEPNYFETNPEFAEYIEKSRAALHD